MFTLNELWLKSKEFESETLFASGGLSTLLFTKGVVIYKKNEMAGVPLSAEGSSRPQLFNVNTDKGDGSDSGELDTDLPSVYDCTHQNKIRCVARRIPEALQHEWSLKNNSHHRHQKPPLPLILEGLNQINYIKGMR